MSKSDQLYQYGNKLITFIYIGESLIIQTLLEICLMYQNSINSNNLNHQIKNKKLINIIFNFINKMFNEIPNLLFIVHIQVEYFYNKFF